MDVINVEQAKIAEECGAVAVMALERVCLLTFALMEVSPYVGSQDDQGDQSALSASRHGQSAHGTSSRRRCLRVFVK